MNILDLLNEGIGERTLYHYTNWNYLLRILKSGHLKTAMYSGGNKTFQISTVRPSKTDAKNLEMLSGSTDGGIKFIIDAAKLSDNVRGAKIKIIAEYPVIFAENIGDLAGVKGEKIKPFVHQFGKDIKRITKENNLKLKDKTTLSKLHFDEELSKKLKELPAYKKYTTTLLTKMAGNYSIFRNTSKEREGEERITFKKNTKIPLDTRYIKIEIEKAHGFYSILTQDRRLEIIELMKKHKNLFVQNLLYKNTTTSKGN